MTFEFAPSRFPFSDRNALLDDYTPETLVGRDDELRDYHSALQPAIEGSTPDNIFLFGKTGVGKTAATRFLFDKLEIGGENHGVEITTKMVNCDGLDTSYRVAINLVNTFRDSANKLSETGHPRSKVYDAMWEAFDNRGGIIILVLDEIDHLQDDSLLYQLSRARENRLLEASRVSIVGISNDLSYRNRLSPKVRSSLCERSINFPAYDADELRAVLSQRAEIAFHEDVLEEGVIPLCAAYGAQKSGDARKSLDLLLKAGDVAREQESRAVTESHVSHGQEILQREAISGGILGLNDHEKFLLYSVATFEAAEKTPIRSSEVFSRYEGFCDRIGAKPLSLRWMHDHLDELEMLGVLEVEKQNEGSTGGQYKQLSLCQDVELVVEALASTINAVGVHDAISSYYERTQDSHK